MKYLDFDDVLIEPTITELSSRSQVTLDVTHSFPHYIPHQSHSAYNGIPIMAANMDGIGTLSMAESLAKHSMFTCLVKTIDIATLTDWINATGKYINNNWAYTMGISDTDYQKFVNVYTNTDYSIKFVCIDVANGYMTSFHDFVKKVRENFPHVVIIAGNVVTPEGIKVLYDAGADLIKVGIGSGNLCQSRVKAGIGVPQFTAVQKCSSFADSLNRNGNGPLIISDGGCNTPGDVAKAFVAGADFVMLGSMLAGTTQSEMKIEQEFRTDGTFIINEFGDIKPNIITSYYIVAYGMSSDLANKKHFGGLKDYRTSEGRTIKKPYQGSVSNVVLDILGGLRSTCTYTNSHSLYDLHKARYIQVNNTHNKNSIKYEK